MLSTSLLHSVTRPCLSMCVRLARRPSVRRASNVSTSTQTCFRITAPNEKYSIWRHGVRTGKKDVTSRYRLGSYRSHIIYSYFKPNSEYTDFSSSLFNACISIGDAIVFLRWIKLYFALLLIFHKCSRIIFSQYVNLCIRIVFKSCLAFINCFYEGNWTWLIVQLKCIFQPNFDNFHWKFSLYAYFLCSSYVYC